MIARGAMRARALAAQVVARVLDDAAWVAPALDAALAREGAHLSPADRGLVTELVYGTLRWAVPLEHSLVRGADRPGRGLDSRIRPHLLVAAYQLQHLAERIPAHAAVNEAVGAIRRVRPGLAGFANALLRRLGSSPHLQLPDDASPSAWGIALGLPAALADATCRDLPSDEARHALLALLSRPALALRWLGPLAEEGEFVRALESQGLAVRAHAFVPHAWMLDGGGAVSSLPGYAQGHLQVQDPGSQLVALLADAHPGDVALDLAAAPGGKTVILSRAVGASGRVRAVEVDPRRAERLRENLARMGANQVDVRVADARAFACADESADVVLLDAPCSGLGTVRRRPDIKLRPEGGDAAARSTLQRELLARASRALKPGGALVYAVCSPMPDEGHDIVEDFLRTCPTFYRRDAREVLPYLPHDAVDPWGQLRLRTHRHECDAFFAVRLERR